MDSLTSSLNYQLPNELQFDKYAQHILENSRSVAAASSSSASLDTNTIALASTPSITSLDTSSSNSAEITTSDLLQQLTASFINSIQLQTFPKAQNSLESSSIPSVSLPLIDSTSIASSSSIMDPDYTPNYLIMNNRNYNTMDEMEKQLEYDKFMNEVWIGIVLTLVLISMIFCFCSCFLYHQFRMWKRNYRTSNTQSSDTEACKISLDFEDPVPEYTLVSGLPSYDAALELLHKNPQSCLIVHPSVFEVFNRNEKTTSSSMELPENQTPTESSTPLLSESSSSSSLPSAATSSAKKSPTFIVATLPSYSEATSSAASSPTTPSLPYGHSLAQILTMTSQKSQSKNKSTPSSPTADSGAEKQLKS